MSYFFYYLLDVWVHPSLRLDTWLEFVFYENLMSTKERVDPFYVRDAPGDGSFMVSQNFETFGFLGSRYAEGITIGSWLFSWSKAYSRCSGGSFSSSLGCSILEGFNRFFGAFHSSGSTGSGLGSSGSEEGPSQDPDGIFNRSIGQLNTHPGLIRHGSVKLPGSPSFWEGLLEPWPLSTCGSWPPKMEGKGPSSLVVPPVWLAVVGCDEVGKGGSRVLVPDMVVIAKVCASSLGVLFFPIAERI
ncbi:hypothetical protein Tco_0764012 [Tanacetum coccineum]